MATVPFLFFFEGKRDFFGITIIVHLPVAKFWAALIVGVHWLSRQVWSSAPTVIENVMAIARACVQDGLLHAGKVLSAGSRWTLLADRTALLQVQIKSALPFCVLSMGKKISLSKCLPGLHSPCGAWCPRGRGGRRCFKVTKSKILFGFI